MRAVSHETPRISRGLQLYFKAHHFFARPLSVKKYKALVKVSLRVRMGADDTIWGVSVLKQLLRLFPGDEWLPVKRHVNGKEGEWWKKLNRGTRLSFGSMVQPELSGRDLVVGETCRYDFGSAHFVAYLLEEPDLADGGDVVAQIIVADGRRDECYLAISKRIDERDQKRLLDEEVIEAIKDQSVGARLHLRASGVVGYAPWVVETYRRQISGIRGRKSLMGRDRGFGYMLFVSPNNEKAIEIEQFDDGTCDMYLTVYRPASDIVSILHAMRPEVDKTHPVLVKNSGVHEIEPEAPAVEPTKVSGQKLADIRAQIQQTVEQEREKLRSQAKAEVVAKAQDQGEEKHVAAVVPSAPKPELVVPTPVKEEVKVAEVVKAAEQKMEAVIAKAEAVSEAIQDKITKQDESVTLTFDQLRKAYAKPDAVKPESLKVEEHLVAAAVADDALEVDLGSPVKIDMDGDAPIVVAQAVENAISGNIEEARIDCHIRVAARIIDEALRGDMRLEDVVRKALGLKIAPAETVSFALKLSEHEYHELAERYGCKADEKQAIHAMIVEELVDFSGERSRITPK